MALTAEQQKGIRRTVTGLVIFIIIIVALMMNKVLTPKVPSLEMLRANGTVVFNTPRVFSDFTLQDHKGRAFTQKNLEGQWSLLYFGFTQCPDVCPTTMMDLNNVMQALPVDLQENLQILLVSLDPARDTPEVLAQYVPYFNPEFIGVTGDFLTIRRFANQVNVAFSKVTQGDDYTIDHSGNIVLINPRGDYHGFFKPPFELEKLKTHFSIIANHYGVDD